MANELNEIKKNSLKNKCSFNIMVNDPHMASRRHNIKVLTLIANKRYFPFFY